MVDSSSANPSRQIPVGSAKGVLVPWDEEVDVAVIGFGGAGSCAAIEAADNGASVLAIDRFRGGGATRMSGGVMYAGGGSSLQSDAGYDDTPEEMFKYLKSETGDAVNDEVLKAFCKKSLSNFEWVEGHGVPYPPRFEPTKTSYPGDDMTLYFSGNEILPPYCDKAQPAPRGHRALGKGMTGKVLFEPLRKAAIAKGVKIYYRTRARRLITDDAGNVMGVEISTLSSNLFVRALHLLFYLIITYIGGVNTLLLKICGRLLEKLEEAYGKTSRVRVKGGVVISSGGYIFNPEMTEKNIPRYAKTMRLGTAGDNGSGIRLGQSAGAAVRKMNRATAWLFINPPSAFLKGILLDRKGERISNEELYGSTLSENMLDYHEGRAILLLDKKSWTEARNQIFKDRTLNFQSMTGLLNLYINNRKDSSLDELSRKCKMPTGSLGNAVGVYNSGVVRGIDARGKSSRSLQTIDTPPYYAVNCDIDNQNFATPSISLGGLSVDGLTGQALREDGSPIRGLYAAGRSAVGVVSHCYVSGLSIADAIFSGRNTGKSAAEAAQKAGN